MSRESIVIRPATQADLPTIRRVVRAAGLPPVDLQWLHFLVAEEQGVIIGVGQVRHHGDGSRELGSLAVIAEWRSAGVGRALVKALIERTSGPLYLFCRDTLSSYYTQFGFEQVELHELPRALARRLRIAGWMTWLIGRFQRQPIRVIAMRHQQ